MILTLIITPCYKWCVTAQRIDELRQQFRHEWLLIAVETVDDQTTTPLTGRLVAHSPDPLELHRAALQAKDPLLMTVYSDDWPADLAACFHVNLPL